jgi:hypothetical protein
MRRRPGNERQPKAALLSVCEENVNWRSEAKRSAAVSFFEGANAARTVQHPENRRSPPQRASTREKKQQFQILILTLILCYQYAK